MTTRKVSFHLRRRQGGTCLVIILVAALMSLVGCREVLPGDPCAYDGNCGKGLFCASEGLLKGQCTADCSSPSSCRDRFGESSFCIGAGQCVLGCDLPSDCPLGTFCNEFNWCQRYCLLDPEHCLIPPRCGNGGREVGEDCDGADMPHHDCEEIGLLPGPLGCDPITCRFDLSGCGVGCGDQVCSPGEDSFTCPQDCPGPEDCLEAEPGGPVCFVGSLRYLSDPEDPTRLLERLVLDLPAGSLSVAAYDPLSLASNPNSPPLAVGVVDHARGYFRIEDVPVPSTGFVAVVVQDQAGAPESLLVPTATFLQAQSGVHPPYHSAYVILRDQEEAWSASIGAAALEAAQCFPGQSLVSCGTLLGVYGHGVPPSYTLIEGVQPLRLHGSQQVPLESTFILGSDGESFILPTTVQECGTTALGTAFLVDAPLGYYSARCLEDTPCAESGFTWDTDIGSTGGAIHGFMVVQIFPPSSP